MRGAARHAETRIGRLRAAVAGPDRLAARLRLESLLGSVDFHPRGLPPDAVLVIRRLPDPGPGLLSLAQVRAPPRWEAALAEVLDWLVRSAARPASGAAPAGAPAVLFASREELLRCLARDLLSGEASARWWWEVLYPEADLAAALREELAEAPERIPPLLQALVGDGRAAAVGRLLDRAQAVRLVRALAERRGLAPLVRAHDGAPPDQVTGGASGGEPPRPRDADERQDAPPWRAFAPEAEAAGAPELELLLGVALLLVRAPATARSATFARDVAAWRGAARAAPFAPAEEPPRAEPARRVHGTAAASRSTAATVEPVGARPAGAPSGGRTTSVRPEETAIAALLESGVTRVQIGAGVPGWSTVDLDRAMPAPQETQPPDHQRARLPETAPGPAIAPALETGLGGLFFLLNLALHLGLYGDFTEPLRPGLALSPWDLLELLGRRLLGTPTPEDPIWRLLARLSARGELPAGRGFAAPRRWKVPRAWLLPFEGEGPWRRVRLPDRFRVEHPAGFALLDRPRHHLDGEEEAIALDRWVGWLADYALARLQRALGLSGPSQLAPLLLHRPARVRAGDVRVDVSFPHEGYPVAIRLAGLDRDPGWIPAAGRQVCFHFE